MEDPDDPLTMSPQSRGADHASFGHSRRGRTAIASAVAGCLVASRACSSIADASARAFLATGNSQRRLHSALRDSRGQRRETLAIPGLARTSGRGHVEDKAGVTPVAPQDVSEEGWQQLRRALRTTVWSNRRGLAQRTLAIVTKPLAQLRANFLVDEFLSEEEKQAKREFEERNRPDPVASVAFIAAATAVLFRVGGRAAVLNLLGMDFAQDSEVQSTITEVLGAVGELDPLLKFSVLLIAWTLAKVFLIDAVTFPLAIVDGVLFGVVWGTLVSCFCATLGSSVAFLASRSFLADKTRARIKTAPGLRAMEKAVAGEGAKTVFTLRLAPLLPIPIGAYAYVYGITRVSWPNFALGTFAGSAKPYFLDAYLGSLLEGLSGPPDVSDPLSDFALFATFVATIAAGTFAADLATSSLKELQSEFEAYDRKIAERPLNGDVRQGDALFAKPSFEDSLEFWGVRATDFPGLIASIITSLSMAQEQTRAVYSEQWAQLHEELGASGAGGDRAEKTDPRVDASLADSSEAPVWAQLRPEATEAAAGWAPQIGLEAAQALLTLPVWTEAVGVYSNPTLWPDIFRDAKDRYEKNKREQEESQAAWNELLRKSGQDPEKREPP